MSRTHHLKTWPEPFQAVLDGRKRHEMRVDDRGFGVGYTLELDEWDPDRTRVVESDISVQGVTNYTGRKIIADVTYITYGSSFGLPANLCVMSIMVRRG